MTRSTVTDMVDHRYRILRLNTADRSLSLQPILSLSQQTQFYLALSQTILYYTRGFSPNLNPNAGAPFSGRLMRYISILSS